MTNVENLSSKNSEEARLEGDYFLVLFPLSY